MDQVTIRPHPAELPLAVRKTPRLRFHPQQQRREDCAHHTLSILRSRLLLLLAACRPGRGFLAAACSSGTLSHSARGSSGD